MHVLVTIFVTVCLRIGCHGGRNVFGSGDARDTAIVFQQDRDAHVTLVKPAVDQGDDIEGSHAPDSAIPDAESMIIEAGSIGNSDTGKAYATPSFSPALAEEPQIVVTGMPSEVSEDLRLEVDHGRLMLADAAGQGRVANGAPSSSDVDSEDAHKPPALYAILAALGASCGYMGLVMCRCVRLLKELTGKKPLNEFLAAPRKTRRSWGDEKVPARVVPGNAEGRTKRMRQGMRLCCPSREPMRLIPPQVGDAPDVGEVLAEATKPPRLTKDAQGLPAFDSIPSSNA